MGSYEGTEEVVAAVRIGAVGACIKVVGISLRLPLDEKIYSRSSSPDRHTPNDWDAHARKPLVSENVIKI